MHSISMIVFFNHLSMFYKQFNHNSLFRRQNFHIFVKTSYLFSWFRWVCLYEFFFKISKYCNFEQKRCFNAYCYISNVFLLIDVHHPIITVYLSCFRSRYRLLARQGTCWPFSDIQAKKEAHNWQMELKVWKTSVHPLVDGQFAQGPLRAGDGHESQSQREILGHLRRR